MQRIRLGFAVLALVLVVPLGILLARTFQGLEQEREARHRAVASRVFDEAERALEEFLRTEESRSPEEYAAAARGDGAPLTQRPWPFVLGYFQVQGDGEREERVRALPGGRDVEVRLLAARALLPAGPRAASPTSPARLRSAASASASAPSSGTPDADPRAEPPRPDALRGADLRDRVQVLEKAAQPKLERKGSPPPAPLPEEPDAQAQASGPYDVLEQLNLGSKRARRSPPGDDPRAARERQVQEREVERDRVDALAAEAYAAGVPDDRGGRAGDGPRFAFVGRAPLEVIEVGDDHLVLWRTAWSDERRPGPQGLVLDLPELGRWLAERVIGASGLGDALELELLPLGDAGDSALRAEAPSGPQRVYAHTYQSPFGRLRSRLTVQPLPDAEGTPYIYAMALLLIAASTAGVWALYRRAATAVHFAERRSNFAAAVTHELKTPLTAIRMYAEMLRDGMVPDAGKRQEYLSTITSESERLTRLIQNVLEFSRLEKQGRALTLTRGDPVEPVRATLATLAPHAEQAGFAIHAELEAGLEVAYDPDAVQQILFNLIDNALKYAADAPSKAIEVSLGRLDGAVTLRVRDHGPGVASHHQPHVFDAFYRGEDELVRRTRGTGIGLALVQSLAAQMGAEVGARNHPEGGFEVELRLAPATAASPPAPED